MTFSVISFLGMIGSSGGPDERLVDSPVANRRASQVGLPGGAFDGFEALIEFLWRNAPCDVGLWVCVPLC
jgi:hypothetical protein